jgi:hypothetical protein
VWDENSGKSKIYRSTTDKYIQLWSEVNGIKADDATYDLPVPAIK